MRRFPSSLLQFTPRDRLPSFFAIGMLCGAAWYFSVPFEPDKFALIAGVVFALIACAWIRRAALPPITLTLAIAALGATMGAGASSVASQRQAHAQIEKAIGPVLLEGWIQRAEPARRGVRLVIRVHAVDGLEVSQTPHTIRLTHISALQTEPGRFVRCWAVLRPPPPPVIEGDYAFDRQAWYSGLGGVGYVQGRCRGGALGAPIEPQDGLTLRIGRVRRQLAQHVNAAAGERAGGFAAALASGDRSFLDDTDQIALRRAGLAHLLAISGLHIGIVGGLVFLIVWRTLALIEPIALRWSVKKPAAFAALMACGAYLIISGASVSTQRAFAMAFVLFGAVLIDRAALTQRSLAIAMIVIIVIAPWSVLTPGFQMSFAATAALITIYTMWQTRRREQLDGQRSRAWFAIKSLLVTSTVTSLATAPYALYHFERVASFSILANIAAMPIISLVTAPAAAAALIPAPLGLDQFPLHLFGLSLEAVLGVAHWVSERSSSDFLQVPKMPASSLACFSAALIIVCLFRGRRARTFWLLATSVLAIGLWAGSARDRVHWAPSGEVFLEHASGSVGRISVLTGDGLAPLRFSDKPVTGSCQPGDICAFRFRDRTIIVINTTADINCRQLTSTDLILSVSALPTCSHIVSAPKIYWTDVIAQNGITFERRERTYSKRRKPDCGRRPWRFCHVPDAP